MHHDRLEPRALIRRQVVPTGQGFRRGAQATEHGALALHGGAQQPVTMGGLVEFDADIGQGENVAIRSAGMIGQQCHPRPPQVPGGGGGADETLGCRRASWIVMQQPVQMVEDDLA